MKMLHSENTTILSEENRWVGGKSAGSINRQPNHCQITLKNKEKEVSFTGNFSYRKYPDKTRDEVVELAKKKLKDVSDLNGLTKNMYRQILDKETGEKYIEVKLQQDMVMLCDIEHLPIVESRIWTADTSNGRILSVKGKNEGKTDYFHILAFPNISRPYHHNRNVLDNRSINIRDKNPPLIQRTVEIKVDTKEENEPENKENIDEIPQSNVPGVMYDRIRRRWYAQWRENGTRPKKAFTVSQYGFEKARELAENARREARQRGF